MRLGLIGGSGLYQFPALEVQRAHRITTNWGVPSAPISEGLLHGHHCLFLARHGPDHRHPPHLVNYRANIAALKELGVETIIATAATGGIGLPSGSVVIPTQLVDYTYGREHTYSDGSQAQPNHIDFTEPFSPAVRDDLIAAAAKAEIAVIEQGVYGVTQGPRLETAAEIDRLDRDGCTVVGMTAMPEAALARELEIPYASLSLVVNAAAGRSNGPITMADIERELNRGMQLLQKIIEQYLLNRSPDV